MFYHLLTILLIITAALAGPTTHRSSYDPMIDRTRPDPYRCYSPELEVPGWVADAPGVTIHNDRSYPAAMWVEGRPIVFWKYNSMARRELADYVIVQSGGVDHEVSVLNPGETCYFVMPQAPIERGRREWALHFELYRPNNLLGEYVIDGIVQRIHTAAHSCDMAEDDDLVILRTGRQHLPYDLGDRPFVAKCRQ